MIYVLRSQKKFEKSPTSISQENIHITCASFWCFLDVQKHPFIGMFDSTALIFAFAAVLLILSCSIRALVGLVTLKTDLLAMFSLPKTNCVTSRSDQTISEVSGISRFLTKTLTKISTFPLSPSTLRAYYGPYASLITFQCRVVENEASAQTDRSLALPPVVCLIKKHTEGGRRTKKAQKARTGLDYLSSSRTLSVL